MNRFLSVIATLTVWSTMGTAQISPQPTSRQILEALVSHAEKEIVPAAEAMTDDKFSFVPNGDGFNGVRTFTQQVTHLAAANYQIAARILGEAPPHHEHDEEAPDSIKSKQAALDYLRGSFAYLRRAVAIIDEKNLVEPIPGTNGTWQRARLGLVVDAIAHAYDHYGQMVEYLRMNNIVPPASRSTK